MAHRFFYVLAGWLAALASGYAYAADLVLEVIPLRYRSAEQVLPIIQPLVPNPGTVSGLQSSLIVRTTPANLIDVRKVLAAIDRLPRRLMITVRQDASSIQGSEGADIAATNAGSHAGAAVAAGGRRPGSDSVGGDARLRARVYGTQSVDGDRHVQQVQVLEGNEAFIQAGESVPVPTRSIERRMSGGQLVERRVETVEYRDIVSGFRVRPQLAGDVVTLQVSPQRDTPGINGLGSANVQRVSTTVAGRLGEWMELGAVTGGQSFDGTGTVYRSSSASADNRRILIKVDALD